MGDIESFWLRLAKFTLIFPGQSFLRIFFVARSSFISNKSKSSIDPMRKTNGFLGIAFPEFLNGSARTVLFLKKGRSGNRHKIVSVGDNTESFSFFIFLLSIRLSSMLQGPLSPAVDHFSGSRGSRKASANERQEQNITNGRDHRSKKQFPGFGPGTAGFFNFFCSSWFSTFFWQIFGPILFIFIIYFGQWLVAIIPIFWYNGDKILLLKIKKMLKNGKLSSGLSCSVLFCLPVFAASENKNWVLANSVRPVVGSARRKKPKI